jgi:hypothetical protein
MKTKSYDSTGKTIRPGDRQIHTDEIPDELSVDLVESE